MKRYLPILLALLLVAAAAAIVIHLKQKKAPEKPPAVAMEKELGSFTKMRSCGRLPKFLIRRGIRRPLIDLSQMHYTGIALRYGPGFRRAFHPKKWERFGHFGTYALDPEGNLYLAPMPFISISPQTFRWQKAIYRIDSKTGELERWLEFEDVRPTSENPYGLVSLFYDCRREVLWASSIDGSTYGTQRGRIYRVDPRNRKATTVRRGFDALTLQKLRSSEGEFLLAGSAVKPVLYGMRIEHDGKLSAPFRILELPDSRLRIRKIRVIGSNRLLLEAIPFAYTLVAQSDRRYRQRFVAEYILDSQEWKISSLPE